MTGWRLTGVLLATTLVAGQVSARPVEPESSDDHAYAYDTQRQRFMDGAALQRRGLSIDVPSWVEDGAFVPLSIELMGARPPVEVLVLRDGEADARIARLQIHRWQEPLRLGTRVRLPASQTLAVLARDVDGRAWQAEQAVEVLGSSCLAPLPPRVDWGEIRLWADAQAEGLALRSLLRHPMETGRRPAAEGGRLPRWLLARLSIEGATGPVLALEAFEGLAANPLLHLVLPARVAPVRLDYVDDRGERRLAQWPSAE